MRVWPYSGAWATHRAGRSGHPGAGRFPLTPHPDPGPPFLIDEPEGRHRFGRWVAQEPSMTTEALPGLRNVVISYQATLWMVRDTFKGPGTLFWGRGH